MKRKSKRQLIKDKKESRNRYLAKRFIKQEEKLIHTNEDWCPNLEKDTVRVGLRALSTGEWRVCIWGGDDMGMEKDFSESQYREAKDTYDKVRDNVTIKTLKEKGFINA